MLKKTIIAILLVFGLAGIPLPAAASGQSLHCQQVTRTVTLSTTDATPYHVAGELCWKGSLQGKTAQLVIHGLTYDHRYWDWPYKPSSYSYVKAATDAGYATFAIDRLGIGQSDKPSALSLTATSSAYVTHQLVQKLRAGTIGGTTFAKVMIVGHSFGSTTSLLEAGTFHDVDAIILTGFAHDTAPAAYTILNNFYLAQLDSKFANSNLPLDYFTTVPGTRDDMFYATANADPAVIAVDEKLKQTVTSGEFASLSDASNPSYSQGLTVPVLLVIGQKDLLFCDNNLPCTNSSTFRSREAQYFGPQACLEAFVLPNAGHDTNLHLNSKKWYTFANDWANRRVGTNGHTPSQPCQH